MVRVLSCQDFVHDHPERPYIRAGCAHPRVKDLWGHTSKGLHFLLSGFFVLVRLCDRDRHVKGSLGRLLVTGLVPHHQ